jgi:hypothetical protein
MLAAQAKVKAAEAPVVTIPASAPVMSEIVRLAAACSSPMSIELVAADAIAAITSGAIRAPPNLVRVPAALILRFTPNCWYIFSPPSCSVQWLFIFGKF